MGKIKKLKKIMSLPHGVVGKAINNMIYYHDNSAMSMGEQDVELICRELRILSHTIEKGMSLPNVRKGFGKAKIIEIQRLLDLYIEINRFDYDNEAFTNAIGVIKLYQENAEKYGCDTTIVNFDKYKEYYKEDVYDFGIRETHPVDVKKLYFDQFAKSRHSSRWFDEQCITDEEFEKVMKLAQTAPSACNRQSSKVVHIKDRKITQQILDIQGGAKGHSNSDIILVISDLTLYRYTSEMFTPYLDGGIFLMNLLYALHYYNINSCPLIWDDYSQKGDKIREIVDIPKNYHIVAVVQAGYAPQNATYAISKRRDNEVIIN